MSIKYEVELLEINKAKNIKEEKAFKILLHKLLEVFSLENAQILDCDIDQYKRVADRIKEDASIKIKRNTLLYFIDSTKAHITNFLEFYNYLMETENSDLIKNIYLNTKKFINIVLERIAASETYIYLEYKQENKNIPEVDEILADNDVAMRLAEYNIVGVYENIYLPQYTQRKIKELITVAPKDEYPLARKMKRKFVIHVGETNTGKTYNSIEALKKVEKGIYLSPLRLLAMEIQDTLNSENVPCSLMTGEEEDIIPGAKHMSATVEKLDINEIYDLCVIDECQMIGDSQRGCFWTRAILGARVSEIHLCTAPEALEILKRIIKECGDSYEVIEHYRNSNLIFLPDDYRLKDAQRGDAIVVFSRKSVLAIASELKNLGINASVIYGALPYAARKKQLERFLNKETDVVVATDAIGMGLNLPIRRIIFFETEKYDGNNLRGLYTSEIKQIAGRAGRKGIYDEGFVLALHNKTRIKEALHEKTRDIFNAYLGFPDELLSVNVPLVEILKAWKSIIPQKPYIKTDVSRMIFLCEQLEANDIHLDKKLLMKVTSIPFDEKNIAVNTLWINYCKRIELKEAPKPCCYSSTLAGYEDYYKCIDLYYTFSKNMGYAIDLEWIRTEKEKTAEAIDKILVESLKHQYKKCSRCGKKLPWNYRYGICEECYSYQFDYY